MSTGENSLTNQHMSATINLKHMKDKKFLLLSGLFFLVFLIGITLVALRGSTSTFLKAKSSVPSSDKSFAIVFPQMGKNIKVIVTIRDADGNILSGRQTKVATSLAGVTIDPSDTQMTDEKGQATYTLTSTITGKATLSVMDVDANLTLANVPSIEFTP